MGEPTWMYRRRADGGVEARVFAADTIPDGWADSPARLDAATAALSLAALTRKQLLTYARTELGVEIDPKLGRAALRREVEALIAGHNAGGPTDDRI